MRTKKTTKIKVRPLAAVSYVSKSYMLHVKVHAELAQLAAQYGSVNKALIKVLGIDVRA